MEGGRAGKQERSGRKREDGGTKKWKRKRIKSEKGKGKSIKSEEREEEEKVE